MDISKYLTVILTTSPIKSHPSTEIIDKTIKSFDYINGLNSCKKFIICDGYAIIENNRYKSGKITEECASHYKEYINSITNKFCNTTIIKRDKRYGFAENVKYALNNLVKTEFVIVIQHDQIFLRSIDLKSVIFTMLNHSDINYIGFVSKQTSNYESFLQSKYNQFYRDFLAHLHVDGLLMKNNLSELLNYRYGLSLLPLVFWYDKPHICKTSYYKDYVFGMKHYCLKTNKEIKVKNFIEDTFGQLEKENIKIGGFCQFKKYGSFLLCDSKQVAIAHSNGRSYKITKYKNIKYILFVTVILVIWTTKVLNLDFVDIISQVILNWLKL